MWIMKGWKRYEVSTDDLNSSFIAFYFSLDSFRVIHQLYKIYLTLYTHLYSIYYTIQGLPT